MKNNAKVPYQFLARINAESEEQLAHWSQKFSISQEELKNIIRIAGPVVKEIHNYLQTLKPAAVGYKTKQQTLTDYSTLVHQRVNEYLDDFKVYGTPGNSDSFATKYWPILMNEVVEEADKIVESYGNDAPEKLQLIEDLKQIAASALLSVPV